jgi:hypothetical protein
MLDLYHEEYGHNIYLVNKEMQVVARNNQSIVSNKSSLLEINDFKAFTQALNKDTSSYEIQYQGDTVLINARYLSSLEWYLLVDTNATQATASLRDALYLNIFVGLFASLSILGVNAYCY